MLLTEKKIGLIIGSGELASYCMEQLILLGYQITILRLPCSQIKIKKNVNFIDIKYEAINKAFSYLKRRNINEIVLIGYMERPEIDASKVTPDSQKILSSVFSKLSKGDGEIFTAIKEMLVKQNFILVKVQDLLPELTLPSGTYGSSLKGEKGINEIKAGVEYFLNYAKLDAGQSLIFQHGYCLGLETITGTDEMIRTTINYRKKYDGNNQKIFSGGLLIKGSKPGQILDIDTPVIGPKTIKLAKKARLIGLVIESNKVILVNKKLVLDLIKSYDMYLVATDFSSEDFQC